jgi:hypothetical protein
MCTIIGKKFKNVGWVGVKNRDRGTATKTRLVRGSSGIDRVTLLDESTKWSEGMNENKVTIISSSLTPYSSTLRNNHTKDDDKNGERISEALAQSTVEKAIGVLKKTKATGCIMVFDADQMWLIEGENKTNHQVVRKITGDTVARTNHGIWIPTAGYQMNSKNTELKLRRISSEARLLIAKYIVDTAKTPDDLILMLGENWSDNLQLTSLVKPYAGINARTTEQLMMIPDKKTMIIRNTDGIFDFNQKDANPLHSKILVGII